MLWTKVALTLEGLISTILSSSELSIENTSIVFDQLNQIGNQCHFYPLHLFVLEHWNMLSFKWLSTIIVHDNQVNREKIIEDKNFEFQGLSDAWFISLTCTRYNQIHLAHHLSKLHHPEAIHAGNHKTETICNDNCDESWLTHSRFSRKYRLLLSYFWK